MNASLARELAEIRRMPYGTARISASEAITRRVEADGPPELLPEALLDLVESYSFADAGQKSFVAFARALRLWDESPELFDAGDQRNLFWEFKWVAADLAEYPQISIEQAEAFLRDMERRFTLAGHGLSSVRMSRFRWAWHAGQVGAEEMRLAWVSGMRDEYEDCRACTIGTQVDFFVDSGRYAEAVELGRTQDDRCNLEPTRTHYALALAALLTGHPELALRTHKRALAGDDGDTTDFPAARGHGFEMLARGGRLDQALRILRTDYPGALRTGASPALHVRFLLGILAGLSANLDRGDEPTGLADPEWGTVSQLHDWVRETATRGAAPLDDRNGNNRLARAIARALAATRTEHPLPASDHPAAVPAAALDAVAGSGGAGSTGAGSTGSVGFDGADAQAAQPDSSGEASFAAAERLASFSAYGDASRAYAAAAVQLAAEGWLERAGAAYAEGAQCAALDHEDAAAHGLFAAAVELLQLDGTDPELLAAVLTAWAPVAARMQDATAQLTATRDALARSEEFDAEGLSEELAQRRRVEWQLRRASLRDTLARSLASAAAEQLPAPLSFADAATAALTAGEEFAQAGRARDAAHSFWLAGRVQRDLGATAEAIWSLESAFEGFTLARARDDRALAAGELIELLRETQQHERAAEIVDKL